MKVRIDFIRYLCRLRTWQLSTFGPRQGVDGVLDHIRKEVDEVKAADGKDLMEWVDIIILAAGGAMSSGFSAEDIAWALKHKLEVNQKRKWPDWRTAEPGKAIEHIKS